MLSVVIPTRDKCVSLRVTLAVLAAQRSPAPHEVVVVDDGCRDATREVAAGFRDAFGGALRVVDGPSRGRAAARNTGARAARGERLLFLDDDVLTAPAHLSAHAGLGAERCFAHGPLREFPAARRWLDDVREQDPRGVAERAAEVLAGREGRLVRNTLESLIAAMDDGRVPAVAPWAVCVGANTSVPRADFERVGGFDEGFGRGWGCEDLELGVRLTSAGLVPRLLAEGAGAHLSHPRPDRWEQHDTNLRRFRALHPRASVDLLPLLLGEGGSVRAYTDACAAAERVQ